MDLSVTDVITGVRSALRTIRVEDSDSFVRLLGCTEALGRVILALQPETKEEEHASENDLCG